MIYAFKRFFLKTNRLRELFNMKKDSKSKFISASAVIVTNSENKILILKRSKNIGSFPNAWNFPAGGEDPGETAAQTAIRECFEETNLRLDESDLIYIGTFDIDNSDRVNEINYFITTKYSGDIKLDWENSEYKWVSSDELKEYEFVPIPDLIKYIFENDSAFNDLIS
tara:strand:- start:112 stop:615 length:504 start_codon:yes stop_codon:yes gene_type:complete